MAYYLGLCIYPSGFTFNNSTYTTDKIDLFPIAFSNGLSVASTSPTTRYVRSKNVTGGGSYTTQKATPFYRWDTIENYGYSFSITLQALNGYKFKTTQSNAVYGVRVGTNSTNPTFSSGAQFSKPATPYISVLNDGEKLQISVSDIRQIQSCNSTTPMWNSISTSNPVLYFALFGIELELAPVIPKHTISYNLTNCVSDYNQTSVDEGTQVTMTITPNLGYVLPNAPTYTTGGVTTQFDKINNSTYTATFTVMNDVTINSSGIAGYEISQTLTNCTSNYNNWYIQDGVTYTIVLTANEGYYFPANSCEYIDSWGVIAQMVISQDGKTASCTFTGESIYQYSGQRITGDAVSIPSEKFGFIGIYKPTNSELLQLALQRFVTEQGETVDLTQYILTLRKYYYDMPIDGSESVYYGTYNTNIMCNFVRGEIIDIDCGEITVNELYHNSLDYENTTATIYLPFIGNTPIDTKRIMGKTLSLKYKLNPVNGDCVALLYDDIGEIYLASGNLSFQIPIKEYNTSVYVNEYVENPLYMASQTPFIEIKTDEIYNNNPLHGYDNNLWVKISDCNGYVLFSDIDLRLTNNITSNIIDEITSLLLAGIYV